LEHETLDGAEVYRIIEELTGEQREPKRVPLRLENRDVPTNGNGAAVAEEVPEGVEQASPGDQADEEALAAAKRGITEPPSITSPKESG
jgi:hypothetical protein